MNGYVVAAWLAGIIPNLVLLGNFERDAQLRAGPTEGRTQLLWFAVAGRYFA